METLLSISFLLIVPATFFVAGAYIFALHDFKKQVVEEMPDVWNAAREDARPLESWMPTAYRLLQKCKSGSLGDHQLSLSLKATHKKAKALLYVTAVFFMLLLLVALSLDAISS